MCKLWYDACFFKPRILLYPLQIDRALSKKLSEIEIAMSKKTKNDDKGLASHDSDQVEGPGNDHWPLLSDEVVLTILRYLPQNVLVTLSMVNKRMRDISRDDSLWMELTLDYEDIKQSEGSCRDLVARCKKLVSLSITHKENFFSSVNSNIMPVVIGAKNCLKSLEVDFSLNYWTDAAMCELSKMKGLRNISFTFNFSQNPKRLSYLVELDQLEIQHYFWWRSFETVERFWSNVEECVSAA